ncbi:MAG: hypothetical protein IT383_27685 [Deltaproteobacteria bacterium]|nr:hypothetical protein [Deltaproteobacteria bacterium]
MKLHGVVDLHLRGEKLLRDPNLWDRLKKSFGAEPDLWTGTMKAAVEATTIVEAARAALAKIGVTNAVSLVIDDQVLFEDRAGHADDLGDLFLAFHNAASVFGQGFRLLRLAAEHEEAGLHLVLEIVALTEHPADTAAARVVISGRVKAYEPKTGESAEAYRARVEPLVKDATALEAHRRQFGAFVSRVADALRASMPEARVEQRDADARITKPSRSERKAAPVAPTDRRYDPFDRYYPNPYDSMFSMLLWSSVFSMAMRPDVVVVNHDGTPLGTADEVSPEVAADPLDASDTSELGDAGGADDMSVDGGGDYDGGDFGGGDFGDFGGFD